MNRFKAPTDPEPQRPYFYIIREKEVFGLEQDNGKGIQFIYEDCGRLINSAQITGNVTEQKILKLMETTAGFRELVHSIGVSIETSSPTEKVNFVFQMYGKNNRCHGGTNIVCPLQGNGAETRVKMSETEWSDDDSEPGQIRFEFERPNITGNVNVRFFLNDGYEAPALLEEAAIDFESKHYREMIERSQLSLGNTARIEKAIRKAQSGEDVTIAFIGGSVTQGAGATPINKECYAYKTYRAFAERFGVKENVNFIKAGVGGTPSELGVIRFDRDVVRGKEAVPDIVVVEFAVNDEGDETKGDCYESLVRKILKSPNQPAVILLFSVFADDSNLQDRLSKVGAHYNLPMVSIKDAVTPQFRRRENEGRVLTKNQFFYDMFHPSNVGHKIMADCMTALFERIKANVSESGTTMEDDTARLLQQEPVIGNTFENVKLLDRSTNTDAASIRCGGFDRTDEALQCVEMDEELTGIPQFPYNWMYTGAKNAEQAYFEMKITCKTLIMIYKDSGEPEVGTADVYVDGRKVMTADPHVNGWIHCNPALLLAERKVKEHVIRICMSDGEEDKHFTILGFGYVDK